MLSREEMIKFLADEYGIHNEKELGEALEKVSINLNIFRKLMEVQDGARDVQEVY